MRQTRNAKSGAKWIIAAACGLGLAGAAIYTAPAPAAAGEKAAAKSEADADIVDTAVAAGKFKTLAAALEAAGLVETLKGEGPFTVFAPTDEAFAKLPEGTVQDLLKPENKDKLTAILTYHVVLAKATSKDVAGMTEATTVNGKAVPIQGRGRQGDGRRRQGRQGRPDGEQRRDPRDRHRADAVRPHADGWTRATRSDERGGPRFPRPAPLRARVERGGDKPAGRW